MTINDKDRAQWVDNDEGLYLWWRQSKQSKARFIRENRQEIDGVIRNVTESRKPAHYLRYEP
jgi:hypothetical protein